MAKSTFLSATALRSAALFGLAITSFSPALAQDDPTAPAPTTAQSEEEEAVVITGSRIGGVTPFNSPDPISVIDPQIQTKEGKSDLASMLQSSPIASGSTQITAAISSNFVTNGGPGAQTVDLRGLGPNRTLVLLNGRRAGPAGTRGGVSSFDLNVLPVSIAERVDILKTGASSVYGSDAVAGVVNIITKTDTNGLELSGNVSAPFDSGGEQYRISAIWGKTFERGHFLIAGDYSHTNELKRGDRDYLACPEAYTFRQDGTRADLINPRTGSYKCEDLTWGHIWLYNSGRPGNLQLDGPGGPNTGLNTSPNRQVILLQYQYPGENLGIPAYGAPVNGADFGAPAGWFPTGYTTPTLAVQNSYHPFQEEQTIIPKTDLYTLYAEGSYEITDKIELFGEFLFNRRETYQNGWRQFWNYGYTSSIWAQGFSGPNLLSPLAITNHNDSSQSVDYYRGIGGLRGKFGGNWKWEIYGQYSRSIGKYRNEQILRDAYRAGYLQTSSCVGTTTPVSGRQCVDVRWGNPNFLRGDLTPQEVAFLFEWDEGKTTYTQLTGEAVITGELFKLPGGPIGVAVGATARRDEINDVPSELVRSGNAWGTSTSGITAGSSVTTEAFGEVSFPLLANVPFFQELTLSAAGRITNVKATRANPITGGVNEASTNGNWTYKLGANWAVTDWLRFRGSYGTSFRAPALFEQFLADETSFPSQGNIDPCINVDTNLALGRINQRTRDNCVAGRTPTDRIPVDYVGGTITATAVSQGGLGKLRPETSKAFVVGTILTPKFNFLGESTRVSIAVDYFDIRVKGEITQLGARNIVYGCYNSLDFPNDPLCSLFTRGQSGNPLGIDEVYDQFVNIASQRNSGVDLTVNVRQDLGRFGSFSATADMTWQTTDTFKLLPTSPTTSDNGEAGSPRWIGDFRFVWSLPSSGTSVFYGLNVIGGTSDLGDFLRNNGGNRCIVSTLRGTYCPDLDVPAVFYHNMSITQEVNDKFEITLGVSNLFNTRPPRVSVLNGGEISMMGPVVAASQYSFVGRRAFINARAKF